MAGARIDRLTAVVRRYAGAIHTAGKANYVIETLPDGRRKIVITHPDTGDRIGSLGATLDGCLDQLEAKLPVVTGAPA